MDHLFRNIAHYDQLRTRGKECISTFTQFLEAHGIAIFDRTDFNMKFGFCGLTFITDLRLSPSNLDFTHGAVVTKMVVDEDKEEVVFQMIFDSIGNVNERLLIRQFSESYFLQFYQKLGQFLSEGKIAMPIK